MLAVVPFACCQTLLFHGMYDVPHHSAGVSSITELYLKLHGVVLRSVYPFITQRIEKPVWMVRLTGLMLCYAAEVTTHVLMAAGLVPFSSASRKFMLSAVGSDVLSSVRALQIRVSCVLPLCTVSLGRCLAGVSGLICADVHHIPVLP